MISQGILSLATIADNNPILLDEALETATAPRCGTILDIETNILRLDFTVQGDPPRSSKPIVDIDLKVAF